MISHSMSVLRRRVVSGLLVAAVLVSLVIPAHAAGSTITLNDGGKQTLCFVMPNETVEAFLTRLEKQPGERDLLSMELTAPLQDGDTLTITRQGYVTYRETRVVPFATTYTHAPEIAAGEETVKVEGKNGSSEFTFRQWVVNGEVVEEELIQEQVITAPVTRQIHMGFRSMPVSQYNFDAEFDENHEPVEYSNVLRGERSAAYTARDGARTASGLEATVGHVAVNPKVIPYGSKLFIQSADGSFIYGYAIAADTGGALLDGRIAVDLYYDSYDACVQHGIQTVDIFVLE